MHVMMWASVGINRGLKIIHIFALRLAVSWAQQHDAAPNLPCHVTVERCGSEEKKVL
jgi:hypothetical protein